MTKSSTIVSARDRRVEIPADRVDRAVGPEQRPQAALAALQEGLVLPVEAVDVAARLRVGQDEPTADRADAGILEPADELPGRRRVDVRVGVGEQDDLALQLWRRPS